MSFCRAICPPVTSSAPMLRLAIKPCRAGCACASRSFSSYGGIYRSSKRDMQTATAFRPHTLPDNFPPPRNIGITDTSIAADAPFIPQRGTAQSHDQTGSPTEKASESSSDVSLREGEAQKPTPVDSSSTASAQTSSQETTKPRRSRLRPRKAAMTLTPAAIKQLRALLSQPDPKMIRVGVKNRGCSGLSYHLEYVDKPGKFDEVVEQDGVKVLIDSKALFSIIGSEMDWHEDKLSQRFIFRNPNIKEQCGCGESFMV
ncbi:hypothetical protein VTN96DRAFT_10357 [Rasamsonia emersonii]|uniref:Iron-sulfur assembly protein 1 n=1 Tax=Rasamsonia emersonii (strain ATCC 16479 / CBS 393.64 / IMI 116815) TaxID=1408163 RepID=A0A0F4YJU2_RASE3|nr:Iron-sulfur cluster assembly accessory protein Isa1 [Rasamsonia emersonii CBS 393.64]KKA17863.1 Iron-sulfur cluster assembly accessory protein Isa1 [Rasamsonia emersonii CBS 393.64]